MKKNYVGIGWEKVFNDGGSAITISINFDKIQCEADQYGNYRLKLGKRKVPDEKSKATHYIYEELSDEKQVPKKKTNNNQTEKNFWED